MQPALLRRAVCLALALSAVSGCAASQPSPPNGATGEFTAIEGANVLARSPRDTTPDATDEAAQALATANSAFALDLYRAVAAGTEGNVIVGPHSISSALAMVYVGARGSTASDEAGTEAGALSGVGIAISHGPTIEFNRPFFFVIRDRPTGAILFIGRVTDPRG